ncbi:hypothetical protein OH492_25105 [Vibrio chagasii]|nr:hypothetical protein [Vibrio chagasii]
MTSADGTEHDITVTSTVPPCAGHRRVTAGCGRSDGRHQLEHGRTLDDQ